MKKFAGLSLSDLNFGYVRRKRHCRRGQHEKEDKDGSLLLDGVQRTMDGACMCENLDAIQHMACDTGSLLPLIIDSAAAQSIQLAEGCAIRNFGRVHLLVVNDFQGHVRRLLGMLRCNIMHSAASLLAFHTRRVRSGNRAQATSSCACERLMWSQSRRTRVYLNLSGTIWRCQQPSSYKCWRRGSGLEAGLVLLCMMRSSPLTYQDWIHRTKSRLGSQCRYAGELISNRVVYRC